MTDILISGICGHMGRNVLELVQADEETRCVCGVDLKECALCSVPVYDSFDKVTEKVDVVIDFSSAANLDNLLAFAKKSGCALVLAATGYTPEQLAQIEESAKTVPVFKTANLSVGINLLQKLVREAAQFLGEAFDVEIVERHHNLKKDAPSGTAYMLAESVNEAFEGSKKYVFGREGMVGAREKAEIGIHAVRGGTIVGEHEVMFAGEDEIITLSHSARSKKVFAAGAVRAAKFVCGKAPGKYDMQDVLRD